LQLDFYHPAKRRGDSSRKIQDVNSFELRAGNDLVAYKDNGAVTVDLDSWQLCGAQDGQPERAEHHPNKEADNLETMTEEEHHRTHGDD